MWTEEKRDDEFDFNIGAKIAFERLNTMRNPHIMYGSMDYGEIGKPTKIKDFKGRNLFVGDVVEKLDDEYRSYGLGRDISGFSDACYECICGKNHFEAKYPDEIKELLADNPRWTRNSAM